MTDRSTSSALNRVESRRAVRRIHWRTVMIPTDWVSAHRAARIAARVADVRERQIQRMSRHGRAGRL